MFSNLVLKIFINGNPFSKDTGRFQCPEFKRVLEWNMNTRTIYKQYIAAISDRVFSIFMEVLSNNTDT